MAELTIVVECVGCKTRKTLVGDEIPRGDMPPFCEKCYNPMVAIRASTTTSTKRIRGGSKEKRQ